MTDASQKELAESILGSILIGGSVSGVRFGALQLLFEPAAVVSGEPYINLSSAWTVFSTRPAAFPENESDVLESTEDVEIHMATSLRHKVVASVEVLEPWPHLVLTFTDNSVLYLNGKNDRYEPWTAGLSHTPPDEQVQGIACPGGELAFILPRVGANNSFKPKPLRGSA
jgi:hypothetical protein